MRKFVSGSGTDSSTAAYAYLSQHRQIMMPNLYAISTAPNFQGQYLGKTFLLTDWPSPLEYGYYNSSGAWTTGTFYPANIIRDGVTSKIGLEVDTLSIEWSTEPTDILAQDDSGNTLLTVIQGWYQGIFGYGNVQVWQAVMPTIGDCQTLGAALLFEGRIGAVELDRLVSKFDVVSRMETLNIAVPTNLIEPGNIDAEYSVGVQAPNAPSSFTISGGSTVNKIYADPSINTNFVLTQVAVVGDHATYNYSSYTGLTPHVGELLTVTGFTTTGNNVTGATITAVSGGASGTVKVAATTQANETDAATAVGVYNAGNDTYDSGYLIITDGNLGGYYASIRQQTIESGHHAFYLASPLPFAPTAGDTIAAYLPVATGYSIEPMNGAPYPVVQGGWTFGLTGDTLTAYSGSERVFSFIYHTLLAPGQYGDVYYRTSGASTGNDYIVVTPLDYITTGDISVVWHSTAPVQDEPGVGTPAMLGFPFVPSEQNTAIIF